MTARFHKDRDPRDEAVARAARELREQLPDLPPDVDARVLAGVLAAARSEEAAAAPAPAPAPPRARRARRLAARPRALLTRPRLALAMAAVVLVALAVWSPAVGPLSRGGVARAVTIGVLPGDCPPPEASGRLEVAGVWDGAEARRFERVLRRFEQSTSIRVAYRYETHDIAPKLRRRVARGCPPDVALLPQPGLMEELARAGALQPADAATRQLVATHYGASWRRLGTVDGRLYGVWFKASNKSLLWYRGRALRQAGIERPPATWSAFLRDAHRLSSVGIRPLAVAGADGWPLTDLFENVYLRSAGPRLYDALSRHQIPWTHPSVVAALRQIGRLLGDSAIVGPRRRLLTTTFEQSVAEALGPKASAAMLHEADFVAAYPHGRDTHATVFPAMRGGSPDGLVVGGDVAVQLSATPAARRLMRFLASPEAAAIWARRGGFLSPNRDVSATDYPNAATARSAATLANATTIRFDLSDLQPPVFGATAGQGMWGLFHQLAAHPDSARTIARRLELAASAVRPGG
jgi:ABC-type glycerol-3-phosphate transport system substrate-binding protein